jgi:hypothetical protein
LQNIQDCQLAILMGFVGAIFCPFGIAPIDGKKHAGTFLHEVSI